MPYANAWKMNELIKGDAGGTRTLGLTSKKGEHGGH